MAPPSLSDDQVNCGPWFLNQQIGDRWISRSTPYGDFDVRQLMAELPVEQYPDVVVCHVDCGFGLKPRNLSGIRCPVVLLAADSHWGDRALSEMIAYATSEPFDRVIVLYDRHHLEFYRAAGVRNVHWFPALTFSHPDARVNAALSEVRQNRLALVGKAGYHFRRQRLFAALIAAKLPLAWRQVRQADALSVYGSSLIGINVVMNGDVNLRVFETIAGGAMLLTDRLSPAAGLDELLAEGREKVSYDNEREFVDRARHYLSHPDEARAIGEAGQHWFAQHFSEKRRRLAFADLVQNGRELPEFATPATGKTWVNFGGEGLPLDGTLACYDVLNELHRQQELVTVQVDDSVPKAFGVIAATLPRVRLIQGNAAAGQPRADLLVCGRDRLATPQGLAIARVWCWDWPRAALPALQGRLTPMGLIPVHPQTTLFQTRQAPAAAHQQKAAEARRYLETGDLENALKFAQEALAASPNAAEAYLVLAELALELKNSPLVEKMLASAKRVDPRNPRIALLKWSVDHQPAPWQPARLLAMAWKAYESLDFCAAESYAKRALNADQSLADAHYVTAMAAARMGDMVTSVAGVEGQRRLQLENLERAVATDPSRPEYFFALGLTCRGAKHFSRAARAFATCVKLDSSNSNAWFGLGEAHLQYGQPEAAASAFAMGLIHTPEHQGLQQYHRRAREEMDRCKVQFAAALFAKHWKRTDCPETKADAEWEQLVLKQPSLVCVRALASASSITAGEALRLVMLAFETAVATSNNLNEHDVPHRTVLFGYQSWFGLDTRELITRAFAEDVLLVLMDGEPVAESSPMANATPANFRSLSHRGLSLWSVCLYRLALHLRSLPFEIDLEDPVQLSAVRSLYGAAAAAIDQANAFCDFYRPESIVIAQGYDVVAAVLRQVGLQRGIRVVAIENTFHRERLLWDDISGIAVNVNQAKNYFWRYRDSISDELAAESAREYLGSIETLKSVEHTSPAAAPICAVMPEKRTITYIGQVGVDSSVLFGLHGFRSQVELIAALAAYAAENSCRLMIKLHPKESPHYPDPVPYYRRLTAGWLELHAGFQESRRRLGDALVIDETNHFSTYEMIRQADVCVTITSQAGLEALLMEKEVVLCGDAFYGGLGFTHEAMDASALGFTLDRILHDEVRRNNGIPCRKFFHIFTRLYCLPKTETSFLSLAKGRPAFGRPGAPNVPLNGPVESPAA